MQIMAYSVMKFKKYKRRGLQFFYLNQDIADINSE